VNRVGSAILALALGGMLLAGCGGSSAPVAQVQTLSASECKQINVGIAKYRTLATKFNTGSGGIAETAVAASDELLTGLAATHAGSTLSRDLLATSGAWLDLSNGLLGGKQSAVIAAEASVDRTGKALTCQARAS
jgi:hypothetical protein